MKQITKEVMRIITKGQDNKTVQELCNEAIHTVQTQMVKNPTVYLSASKNKQGKTYMTSKIFWPTSIDTTKEIRIYVGKYSEYPLGTKDPKAFREARKKMKERLKRELV
jgi:hypothetical protein